MCRIQIPLDTNPHFTFLAKWVRIQIRFVSDSYLIRIWFVSDSYLNRGVVEMIEIHGFPWFLTENGPGSSLNLMIFRFFLRGGRIDQSWARIGWIGQLLINGDHNRMGMKFERTNAARKCQSSCSGLLNSKFIPTLLFLIMIGILELKWLNSFLLLYNWFIYLLNGSFIIELNC